MAAEISLVIESGCVPNQLVYGKNPGIPSIEGELTPVSTEIGVEEEYLRNILEGMRKVREIHVQQESVDQIKSAIKGRIQEHKI